MDSASPARFLVNGTTNGCHVYQAILRSTDWRNSSAMRDQFTHLGSGHTRTLAPVCSSPQKCAGCSRPPTLASRLRGSRAGNLLNQVQPPGATRGQFPSGRYRRYRMAWLLPPHPASGVPCADGILRVGLNRLHQRRDLAWHLRTFSQSLRFGTTTEAATGFTCGDAAWMAAFKGQNVGLFGNVRNQLRDFTDLLGRLASRLMRLGFPGSDREWCSYHRWRLYSLPSRTRRPTATGAQPCGFLRLRTLVDSSRHITTDLPVSRISYSCSLEAARSSVSGIHLWWFAPREAVVCTLAAERNSSTVVHGSAMAPVMSSVKFRRQIAFRHCLQLVHQTQNSGLVGVVHAFWPRSGVSASFRCTSATTGACGCPAAAQQTNRRTSRQNPRRESTQSARPTADTGLPELGLQFFERATQRLAAAEMMASCASRADTRPCRLPRMALA